MFDTTQEIAERQKLHPFESRPPKNREETVIHLMHLADYEHAASILIENGCHTVLDLGCNDGYGAACLTRFGLDVTGVDVSRDAIAKATASYPGIKFIHSDRGDIPGEPHSFDAVVSFQVIEHVPDVSEYLARIHRALRPGGIAIFTTPNRVLRLDPGMSPWNRFHVTEFSCAQLSATIEGRFESLHMYGQFATDEIMAIETSRCAASLARHRKNIAKARRNSGRPYVIRLLVCAWRKTITALKALRSRLSHTKNMPGIPFSPPKEWTSALFTYRETDIDKSLTLVAVCKAPSE